MTTPTWIALDDYLVAHFTAKMGQASAYTTLKLAKVDAVMLRDKATQWEAWGTANQLPALIVEGNNIAYGPGAFGNGQVMLAQEFAYVAVAIVRAATDVLATREIKELVDRTVQAITEMRISINNAGEMTVDGKLLQSAHGIPTVTRAHAIIYPAKDELAQWFGLGLVDFTVGKRR
jgi:hypothetical protein